MNVSAKLVRVDHENEMCNGALMMTVTRCIASTSNDRQKFCLFSLKQAHTYERTMIEACPPMHCRQIERLWLTQKGLLSRLHSCRRWDSLTGLEPKRLV